MTPTLTTLLNGYSLRTAQGSPAFCSIHLVESDAGRLLFDCGHAGRRRWLLEALAARGLEPADIGTVVLSHGHWDHIQNVDFFQEARVLLHADELRNLADPPATDLGTPRWARRILDDLDVHTTGDGDEPLPGVQVLDLPGHTPGSIGLAVNTDAGTAVLSADAVPTAEVLRAGAASGRPYDQARADASVKRVAQLADLVYPGHDTPFRLDASGVPQYLVTPEPLAFSGRSRVTSEQAS
ncbi:MBL fold metallo-hydrolase [Kribbella sp. NPDC026596]|uniref:MBL fold metallo-hydrolase n=1 Tax=Kribbella sp. NPDC026596 TaxID=3155122 RepID=UPI0033EE83D7